MMMMMMMMMMENSSARGAPEANASAFVPLSHWNFPVHHRYFINYNYNEVFSSRIGMQVGLILVYNA